MGDWKNVVRATLREETAMQVNEVEDEHRVESAIRMLEERVQSAAEQLNDVLRTEGHPPAEVVKVARGAGLQFRPDRGRPFVWQLAVADRGGQFRVESEVRIHYPDGQTPETGPLDGGELAQLTPEALCESFADAYRIATDSSAA